MLSQLRHALFQKLSHDGLVDASANHQLVVVKWQQSFNNLAQHKETLLFIHDLDQAANY